MRIWDLNPGYLNRQSLLGEHRELHGLVSIIKYNKKGYSKHPETLRWIDFGWALKQRHKLLVAEMKLRGYTDKSPVLLRSKPEIWPETYIVEPEQQIYILKNKYKHRESGRISLAKNAQDFWAQHKYSVMARNIAAYKDIGKWVTSKSGSKDMRNVSL
ncbi:MAG: pyrimidine dimer DNA glycosylase/endonuclease V, partial [Gammaproteobacteria bacterium]|nr:pyrimidine dimer DNA glycosylase/endonuclease V [Gammaproteobacteria bacterium]